MVKNGLICGVGVNDFKETIVGSDGSVIGEYSLWVSVIHRCYSNKSSLVRPTYRECEVEPFLLSFTNFYNFIRGLKGFGEVDEKGKPFQMDKDLLVKGNKTYGVDTICFIPQEINSFLTNRKNHRGNLPVGVVYHKRDGLFQASIRLDGRIKYLGGFKTVEEAFRQYKIAKENQAKVLAERWREKIDPRVYHALMNYEVNIDD